MNATLEGMAQALFKSWFVDFDPVIDNALAAGNPIPDEFAERAEVRKNALANGTTNRETAKDFPDAFQFTEELGWIPEGWEVAKAENLVTRHKVKQKFTKKNALEAGPVPIFDQGAGLLLGYSELPADQDSSKENPKFIFGDHTCITHLSTKSFSVGPNVIPLSAKKHDPYWTYYAVKDLQEFQEYRRHWMEFSIKETVLPSSDLASIFDNQIKEFRSLMESNEEASKTLLRLRDTLLPKLISGEIALSTNQPFTT
jgi:type I restriction enzyme S subunit